MTTKPREEPVDLVIKLDFIYCNLTSIHLIKMIFYILKGFYPGRAICFDEVI